MLEKHTHTHNAREAHLHTHTYTMQDRHTHTHIHNARETHTHTYIVVTRLHNAKPPPNQHTSLAHLSHEKVRLLLTNQKVVLVSPTTKKEKQSLGSVSLGGFSRLSLYLLSQALSGRSSGWSIFPGYWFVLEGNLGPLRSPALEP